MDPGMESRKIHLSDLSGPLELIALLVFVGAVHSLRRRELSLAWLTHCLAMVMMLGVTGHFLEEHALGRPKLEALLMQGFQSLSRGFGPVPRGWVAAFEVVWELSGVLVVCGAVLWSRLWRCGLPEDDPSCVAEACGMSGRPHDSRAHRRCRVLRLRFYGPVFLGWWCAIVFVMGARFNSMLGGSAIRPQGDRHYFLQVLKSGPMLATAFLGATVAVWLYAELLSAEGHPLSRRMLQQLSVEMEQDELRKAQLSAQLQPTQQHPHLHQQPTQQYPQHQHLNGSVPGLAQYDELGRSVSELSQPSQYGTPSLSSASTQQTGLYSLDTMSQAGSAYDDVAAAAAAAAAAAVHYKPPSTPQQQQPFFASPKSTRAGSFWEDNPDFHVRAARTEAAASEWARQRQQSLEMAIAQQLSDSTAATSWTQAQQRPQYAPQQPQPPPQSQPQPQQPQQPPYPPHPQTSPPRPARAESLRPPGDFGYSDLDQYSQRGQGDVSHLISSDSEEDGRSQQHRAHVLSGYEQLDARGPGTRPLGGNTTNADTSSDSDQDRMSGGSRPLRPQSLHPGLPLRNPTGSAKFFDEHFELQAAPRRRRRERTGSRQASSEDETSSEEDHPTNHFGSSVRRRARSRSESGSESGSSRSGSRSRSASESTAESDDPNDEMAMWREQQMQGTFGGRVESVSGGTPLRQRGGRDAIQPPSPQLSPPPASSPSRQPQAWKQLYDPDSRAYYWFNESSGESSWHTPDGVDPGLEGKPKAE